MQKIKYIDTLCLFNCFLLSIICIFLGVSQDTLLFKSDFVNLLHFILGINVLALFILLISLIIPFLVLGKKSQGKITDIFSLLIPAHLLFGFSICAIDRYFSGIQPVSLFLLVSGGIYIVSLILVALLVRQNKNEIRTRIIKFSKGLTLFVLISFLSLTLFRHAQKKLLYPQSKRKNVVMIVLDGLNTDGLPQYNKNVNIEDFDHIANDSKLYMNIYTNIPATRHYFNILYSGRKDMNASENNLFSAVQQAGVNTRWLSVARASIPDALHITSYSGLRSLYLHHKLSWIPYFFGIDYNVQYVFAVTPMAIRALSPRQIALRKLMNIGFGVVKRPLETYLVEEIRKLRSENRPYFLIFHANVYWLSGEMYKDRPQKLFEILDGKLPINRRARRIKKNEYVYKKKDSWLIKKWKKAWKRKVGKAMESLRNFYNIYKKEEWDKDTVIIITADHGKIFSRGKVWYRFHNNEEVTRVPLLIHDGENQGIDSRLGETIDITQTILELFNIKERFSDKAASLIGDDGKKSVTSLTIKSNIRNEQFLNIYKHEEGQGYRYVFDLEKTNFARKELLRGYDTIEVDRGVSVFDDMGHELKSVLKDYGIR